MPNRLQGVHLTNWIFLNSNEVFFYKHCFNLILNAYPRMKKTIISFSVLHVYNLEAQTQTPHNLTVPTPAVNCWLMDDWTKLCASYRSNHCLKVLSNVCLQLWKIFGSNKHLKSVFLKRTINIILTAYIHIYIYLVYIIYGYV